MDFQKVIYDNTPMSKLPPQIWRGLIGIFFTIFGIPFIILLIIINTIIIEKDLIIRIIPFPIIVSIGTVIYFLCLIKYLYICPNAIYFERDEMVLVVKDKKKKIDYGDIVEIIFSFYSYDKDGSPCPRWNVRLRSSIALKTICLTEDNAIRIRKELDDRKLNYKWDDHIREIWEQRINKSKYNKTPK